MSKIDNSARNCLRCGKPLSPDELYCTFCRTYNPPDNATALIYVAKALEGQNTSTALNQIAEALERQSKKRRDWPDLIAKLAIPLVIVVATIGFGWWQFHSNQTIANQQYNANQSLALDQQRAAILQTYLDNIQYLLLNDNLGKSQSTDPIAILARARTLTALQGLDPKRKGALVLFLYEAHLIGFKDINDHSNKTPSPHVINLKSANLTDVDLAGIILKGANLSASNLSGADFEGANLEDADLTFATLTGADFKGCFCSGLDLHSLLDGTGANFTKAQLRGANFLGDNLKGANFSDADLTKAALFGSELNDARFIGANLTDAYLSPAYLSSDGSLSYMKSLNAKPIPTDLSGADLEGANLNGANLNEAILMQSQLDHVSSCKDAILPQGLTCSRQ